MTASVFYLLIVSEHNLAEFQACIELQPQQIGLVISNRMLPQAKRLKDQLQQHPRLSSCLIKEFSGVAGDDLAEIDHWVEQQLKPQLKLLQTQHQLWLNMTGGTKPLAYWLAQAWPWQQIHYQAFRLDDAARLERFYYQDSKPQLLPVLQLQQPVKVLEHARLYLDEVNVRTASPVVNRPQSLTIGQRLLEYYQLPAAEQQQHPHYLLTNQLKNYWFGQQRQKQEVLLSTSPALETWLTDLAELLPKTFQQQADQWRVSTALDKKSRDERQWLSGLWFEQWVDACLGRYQIPTEQRGANVQLHRKTDEQQLDTGREADLLLSLNNQLYLLELKVDLPEHGSPKDAAQQLDSLSPQLGKIRKMLVFTPSYRQKRSEQQWAEFCLSCKTSQIELCELTDDHSLARALKLSHIR